MEAEAGQLHELHMGQFVRARQGEHGPSRFEDGTTFHHRNQPPEDSQPNAGEGKPFLAKAGRDSKVLSQRLSSSFHKEPLQQALDYTDRTVHFAFEPSCPGNAAEHFAASGSSGRPRRGTHPPWPGDYEPQQQELPGHPAFGRGVSENAAKHFAADGSSGNPQRDTYPPWPGDYEPQQRALIRMERTGHPAEERSGPENAAEHFATDGTSGISQRDIHPPGPGDYEPQQQALIRMERTGHPAEERSGPENAAKHFAADGSSGNPQRDTHPPWPSDYELQRQALICMERTGHPAIERGDSGTCAGAFPAESLSGLARHSTHFSWPGDCEPPVNERRDSQNQFRQFFLDPRAGSIGASREKQGLVVVFQHNEVEICKKTGTQSCSSSIGTCQ